MELTPDQIARFQVFGFLVLPGQLAREIGWITEEFEAVHAAGSGPTHDGTRRTCIVPFIDQSERLCTLLDHPGVCGVASALLGDGFNYVGGDGNFYTGDTGWHSDGFHAAGLYVKMALYLDPVGPDSGCLRVIPGSHWKDGSWPAAVREACAGADGRAVPCRELVSVPGDVVVFNHNLMHASFGGGARRRMFTLNLCRRARGDAELNELKEYIGGHARFWIEQLHSETMRSTGPASRMRHLEQVMENEGHLADLARAARESMNEPSRG